MYGGLGGVMQIPEDALEEDKDDQNEEEENGGADETGHHDNQLQKH